MKQGFCTAYIDGTEHEKLSKLRAKTDQQLLNFIHSKLDFGLSFTVLAEVEYSAGDPACAEKSLAHADQAFNEVQQLRTVLNEEQRQQLDRKLGELRKALDHLYSEKPRTRTASTF